MRPAAGLEEVTLAGVLPPWDVERRRADVTPLAAWVLAELSDQGVRTTALDRLHEVIDAERAPQLSRHLTDASTRRAPRQALHALVREALPSLAWEVVAIQAIVHFRLLVPGDAVSPVPLHTDFGIGHSLDERNLWIALTPARGTAALHLARLEASMASDRVRREGGRFLIDPSTPTRAEEAEAGDVLLFTPLHVHGARVVDGERTRVSVDVRIAPLARARARNPFGYIPVAR
jgi:hypothetical protein